MINTYEQAVEELDAMMHDGGAVYVFYGSRVRGTASLDSDWDVVMITPSAKEEKRVVNENKKLDILIIPEAATKTEAWTKRELCALLMGAEGHDCVWLNARPFWPVDWPAIIEEKRRRVLHLAEQYMKALGRIPSWNEERPMPVRDRQLTKLRRWAQRVVWMDEKHEVPSTPELDAKWRKTKRRERYALLAEKVGIKQARVIEDIDIFA